MIEYKIKMMLPEGWSTADLQEYIKTAIGFAGGWFHPDHPFFSLRSSDVHIEEVKRVPEKINGEPYILDVCLDIHTQNSGSLERQPDYEETIAFLKQKLLSWKPSPDFTRDFDDAVKNLIATTLKESEIRNKII